MSGGVTWRIHLRADLDAGWDASSFRANGVVRVIDRGERRVASAALAPLERVGDALVDWRDVVLDPAAVPDQYAEGVEVRLPPPLFLRLRQNDEGLRALTDAGCNFEVTEPVYTLKIVRGGVTIEADSPDDSARDAARQIAEPLLDRVVQLFGDDPALAWALPGPLHRKVGLEAAHRYLRMRWIDRIVPRDFFWVSSQAPQGELLWRHPTGLTVHIEEEQGPGGLPGKVGIRVDHRLLELPAPTGQLEVPVLRRAIKVLLEPGWQAPMTLVLNRSGEPLAD